MVNSPQNISFLASLNTKRETGPAIEKPCMRAPLIDASGCLLHYSRPVIQARISLALRQKSTNHVQACLLLTRFLLHVNLAKCSQWNHMLKTTMKTILEFLVVVGLVCILRGFFRRWCKTYKGRWIRPAESSSIV